MMKLIGFIKDEW